MIGKRLLLLIGCLLGAHGLFAQSGRSDAAARTAQSVDRAQAAGAATIPAASSEQTEADLGYQHELEGRLGKIAAYGSAETGLFYTSNANLTPGGGSGDMYFFARGIGGLRPHLGGGLYLDGYVSQEIFEYARFSSLNFLKFSTGGGFNYAIPGTNGLFASVKYKYEQFNDTQSYDQFFVNNAIDVGLAKEFSVNDSQAFQVGWKSSFSVFTEPESVRRDEHTFWVGWRVRLADPLELQIYDFVSLYYYPNISGRFDVTNYSGASLNLALTRWARLSAIGGFSVNSSTQSIYNYTAATVGGSINLNINF